jgi:hypothetical protein
MNPDTLHHSNVEDFQLEDPPEDLQLNPIQNRCRINLFILLRYFLFRYCFWFRNDNEKSKTQPFNYKDSIKKIGTFHSVSFHCLFSQADILYGIS